jgi:hypothetical protein
VSDRAKEENPLRIEDYRLQYGNIAGSTDPKERRRVLQLVIRGYGWVICATPVIVIVGDEQMLILSSSPEGTELTCLLPEVPKEGASIMLSQGDRTAPAPRRFSRKELPVSGGRAAGAMRRKKGE